LTRNHNDNLFDQPFSWYANKRYCFHSCFCWETFRGFLNIPNLRNFQRLFHQSKENLLYYWKITIFLRFEKGIKFLTTQ
jgi:hypothetical protein